MPRAPRTGATWRRIGRSVRRTVAMAVCLAALALAGSAPAADVGANDDTGKFAADARRGLLRPDGRARAEAVRDDDALPPERSDDDPGRRRARPRDPGRRARRPPASRSPSIPYPPREIEDGTATPAGVRDLAHARRAALPDGEAVRRHERAEPAGVPAAAVRPDRQERLGGAGRARSSRPATTR